MPNPIAKRLIHKYTDRERVWHGSPEEFSEQTLDSPRSGFQQWDEAVEGTYFAPDREIAEGYRHKWPEWENEPGPLVRAEIPAKKYLLDMEEGLEHQSPYVRERLGVMSEEQPFMRTALDEAQGSPGLLMENIQQGVGRGGNPSPGEIMGRYGIPGLTDAEQRAIWSPNDFRVLGRSRGMAPVGIGTGVSVAPSAEDTETMERLSQDKGAIYGPKHPRLLGGIDAVRKIPGAEFMAGGLLDLAEDYAFDTGSTTEEKVMGGLELAGAIPIGRLAGALGKKLGMGAVPEGKLVEEISERDEILDSIENLFGRDNPTRNEDRLKAALEPDEWDLDVERLVLDRERTPMERVARMPEFEKIIDEAGSIPYEDLPTKREIGERFDESLGRLRER